jgi:hypothetical protein
MNMSEAAQPTITNSPERDAIAAALALIDHAPPEVDEAELLEQVRAALVAVE